MFIYLFFVYILQIKSILIGVETIRLLYQTYCIQVRFLSLVDYLLFFIAELTWKFVVFISWTMTESRRVLMLWCSQRGVNFRKFSCVEKAEKWMAIHYQKNWSGMLFSLFTCVFFFSLFSNFLFLFIEHHKYVRPALLRKWRKRWDFQEHYHSN